MFVKPTESHSSQLTQAPELPKPGHPTQRPTIPQVENHELANDTSLSQRLAESKEACEARRVFAKHSYPADHWAGCRKSFKDNPELVAIATYMNSEYEIYLNPGDKRGFRSIVKLVSTNGSSLSDTYNRPHTPTERAGIHLLTSFMEDCYAQFLVAPQSALASNNAHRFNAETGKTELGKESEPLMLHAHIFGRDNPNAEILPDLKVDGPIPGLIFDMRGKTSNEAGNDSKVKWTADDMIRFNAFLKTVITERYPSHQELGFGIKTE